jgi:repressor LexA
MTRRLEEYYKIIKSFIEKNGYSPTIREIGELAGTTSSATSMIAVRRLKKLGYIEYEKGKNRTIRCLK